MADPRYLHWANILTGGADYSLDAIDGADLADLHGAFAITATKLYPYVLDADDAGAESSPDKISPDSNAGDKRWDLLGLTIKDLTLRSVVNAGADVDKFLVLDASNNVDFRTGAEVLADLSGDAAAAFSFNSQNLTGVGSIGCGAINSISTIFSSHASDSWIKATATDADGWGRMRAQAGSTSHFVEFFQFGSTVAGNDTIGVPNAGLALFYAGSSTTNLVFRTSLATASILFGAGTGAKDVEIDSNGNLDIATHNASTIGLKLGGTLVTASAAEINILDAGATPHLALVTNQIHMDLGNYQAFKIQTGASIADEALWIQQIDADQAFINFDGTSGAGSNIEPTEKNTYYRMIMVEILGVKKYIKAYDA